MLQIFLSKTIVAFGVGIFLVFWTAILLLNKNNQSEKY